MRIAVTGAGGFLGLNLVRGLAARGHEVLAIDRSFGDRAAVVLDGAEGAVLRSADVRDRAAIEAALGDFGARALFHGATLTADLGREKTAFSDVLDVNVTGTARVLEAAREAGVARMIVASSSAVYGDAVFDQPPREIDQPRPVTLYGITKLAAEQAARRFASIHGLDVRVMRISAVYGPFEHRSGARDVMSPLFQIAEKAVAGQAVRLPSGGGRDWIAAGRVADAVAALLAATSPAHEVYNVAAQTTWEPAMFAAALSRLVGLVHETDDATANIDYRDDLSRRRFALDTSRLGAEFGDAVLGSVEDDAEAHAGWVAQNPHWFR